MPISPFFSPPFLFFLCANLSSVEGCSDSTLSPFLQQSVCADLTASWRGCNGWWFSCYKTPHFQAHAAPEGPPARSPRGSSPAPPARPLPALGGTCSMTLPIKCRVIPHPERSSTPRPADLLLVLRSQTARFRIPFLNTQVQWIALTLPFQMISLGLYHLICHAVIYVFTWLFPWWETVPMSYSFLDP